MKESYSSGIPYLDNLMGGILLGDNVVWALEPGTYFDFFLESFLTVKNNAHFKNIYVSFDFPPSKVYARYKDYFNEDDFILIDAFTFGKGKGDKFFQSFYTNMSTESKQFRVHSIEDMNEPAEFIRVISELEEEFKEGNLCKYVFDSLTGMQELWGEEESLRFFTYTCPKLFELKALAYWPLAKDAHSKAFLANISNITQLVIDLHFQEDSTCAAKFLKLDGRSSRLLNIVHHYNFHDNKITFIEPYEKPDKEGFKADRFGFHGRGQEGVPSFLRNRDPVKIGARILDFRKKENLSQVELARMLNITPSALSQIEHDQSLPSLQLFVDIARFFRKSLDSFFVTTPASFKPERSKKK